MNFTTTISVIAVFVVACASGLKELDSILPLAKQEECRNESNYRGELNDEIGQNVTQELKCFAACALVKLEIMNEKDGTINLNMAKLDEIIESHTGGKEAAAVFKSTVVEPCVKAVEKSIDYCEYSFQLVSCGMMKLKHPS